MRHLQLVGHHPGPRTRTEPPREQAQKRALVPWPARPGTGPGTRAGQRTTVPVARACRRVKTAPPEAREPLCSYSLVTQVLSPGTRAAVWRE